MKKRILLGLLFLGVLLVISGCVEKETAEEKCEKITDSLSKNDCYLNAAIETKDINLCEKITEDYRINTCYACVALETKDAGLCEKISINDERGTCYYSVAIETKDSNLCEKINDSAMKDYCYTRIVGGITDSVLKDYCYTEIAEEPEEKPEEKPEEEMGSAEIKTIAECEEITNSEGKENCYYGIAIETKDPSLCQKITNSIKKDGCYYGIAIETKDLALCDKITVEFYRDVCYAVVKEDASICETIADIEGRGKDTCYYYVAIATKDGTLCEKITRSDSRETCYTEIA